MTRSARWVAATFDRRAPRYDLSAMHRWQAELAVEFLAPVPGQRILDVATGTGLAARAAAARLGSRGAVIGVDISAGMLRQAQQAPGERRCWFVRADAAAAPFPAEVFDAVLCVAAVPYFADLARVLREWRRVCRPQAQAVVSVPAADGIPPWRALRQAAAGEGLPLADPSGPLADSQQRARTLAAAGWTCEQVRQVVFEQPREDPQAAFRRIVDSGLAEPLRSASKQVQQPVWARFETLYRAESLEAHRTLLLRLAVPAA
jgi:ubiquinone/menaquinone biosynthesis C-methylase UbiE